MLAEIAGLHHIGIPALTVNEHGRIVAWNPYAGDFFRQPGEAALGSEWHTIVRSVKSERCCALCQTRRSLRYGEAAQPVEATVLVAGCQHRVVLVPVPAEGTTSADITFLIIDEHVAGCLISTPADPGSSRSRVRHLEHDRMIDELTLRERDILTCVVDGLDARGIASSLGISHATARNYVQRILTKLGVRNKAEAVNVALTYNLLAR
jgi:DNA-binding CsgD family transcriptional regulator